MRAGYPSRLLPSTSTRLDGSGAQDGLTQGVQADPADVQRATVKGLDIKGITLACLDLVAQLEPETLADLVRGCLPWPAEISIELEAQEVLGHVGVSSQELPRLVVGPLAPADLGRCLETAMDPDVQDH